MDAAAAVGRVGEERAIATRRTDDELASVLPGLYRFARLVCADAHLAEDLVVEAIARTLPHCRRGRVSDPDRYLRRALVNLLHSWGRRQVLRGRHELRLLGTADAVATETPQVDDAAVLLPLLRELPPRQRAVVVLRFYEDRSVSDVAVTLSISEGTVKSQTSKALTTLRERLEANDG